MVRGSALVIAVCCLILPACAPAADWPQFHGPTAKGIAPDTGINKNWNERPPRKLWQVPMSDQGYAGPCAAEGKVFIIDHVAEQDVVRAFTLDTGQPLWQFPYPDPGNPDHGYARATPAYSEGRLYTLSRYGALHCLNAATGEKIWSRDLQRDLGGTPPTWAYACSPVVDGEKLIVFPGGAKALAALDKLTGRTIWQGGPDGPPGYATPVVAEILGRRQYVAINGRYLFGVDAQSGETLWYQEWVEGQYLINAATPIVEPPFVFVSTGYGKGCGLFEITPQGPKAHWVNKELQAHFNTPIYYAGYIWGIGDNAGLVCLSPRQGIPAWKQRGFNKGGVIAVDGVILAMDGGSGTLVMVKADASAYQELGRFTPLGGQSWTAPIIADGKLVVRNTQALACFDLM